MLNIDTYVTVEKNIALWNNSSENLYNMPDTQFFKPTDIHALVTGSVEYIDSYVHATVRLVLFPGNVIEFELRDAEKVDLVKNLSKRISDELFAQYSNKQNITLNISVSPKEAQENAVLHINGIPYRKEQDDAFTTINVINGIYDIYVESPGYKSVAISQYFGDEDIFTVEISLKKQLSAQIDISDLPQVGDLFFNVKKTPPNATEVTINTIPVLGEFVREDGVSTWFILDSKNNFENLQNPHFSLHLNKENPADVIEKKRKIMYHSYSALIASLPLYFIAHGQYINEYNSWGSGNSSGSSVSAWKTAENVSMGVSIGLGINFLVQLGLYIYSVNAILPEEITIE